MPKGDHAITHLRVAAVVLAAGMSTRMGSNKLLAEIEGEALVRRVVRSVEASGARPVVVVTGYEHASVCAALAGAKVVIVYNPAYRDGLSTSLRSGITRIADCDAAIILLGDMPAISSALIDKMIAAYDPANARAVCVATHNGRRGNPVLFGSKFFPELMTISGDVGARHVVARHPNLVCEVEAGDDGPAIDVDTPEDLQGFLRQP